MARFLILSVMIIGSPLISAIYLAATRKRGY